jgi:filamentous hemagglutinin family protein
MAKEMGMKAEKRESGQDQANQARRAGQLFRLAPLARAMALMLAAGGAAGSAHAAPAAFSSGWFAAKGANQSQARTNGVSPSSLIPTGAQQSQQAQQKLAQSINNLARVASGIAAQQAMQNAQRLIAMGQPRDVQDGLAAGGLSVDNDNAWINAQLGPDAKNPSKAQTIDPSTGHVTVTVQQNASRAIANWSSFNVGKNTTLYFDQSAGTQTNGANNWAILNRVNDPKGKPSEILGQIKAEGSVYVINRNGIIFGGASQVNVHSLLASSLDFLNTNDDLVQTQADIAASNKLFLGLTPGQAGGLAALEAGTTAPGATKPGLPNEVLGLGHIANVTSASDYPLPGDVTIAPGAQITTQTTGSVSDGGFVLIAAPHVSNGGTITSTAGQVVLAAGVGVSLRPNQANPQTFTAELSGMLGIPLGNLQFTDVTPAGALVNNGIVDVERGNITLLGSSVTQNGVARVTTSVNTTGSITISTVDEYFANTPTGDKYRDDFGLVTDGDHGVADQLHRAGTLTLGNVSVTTIMPDTDGQTATSASGVTFTPGNVTITTGSAWFQNGSLIEAPGANVSIAALTQDAVKYSTPPGDTSLPGRILVDSGATIDVSGLAGVQLPISDTIVTIARIGQNELADSPLQRDSALFGLKNVVIDSTLRGTRSDGTPWVGSPVLNAQGYVDLIPRSIDQLMTQGGTITLAGNEVLTAVGSSLNVSGGYTHYQAGQVTTTRVVDAYGRIVPIGQVDPDVPVVGIAGQYVENHARWGVSTTWSNPLMNRPVYQDEFIVGDNAGTINVFGTTTVVLDGAMNAQVVAGGKQIQNASQPLGGTLTVGKNVALAETANTSNTGETGLIIIRNSAVDLADLASDFSIDTPLDKDALADLSDVPALASMLDIDPDSVRGTIVIPADTLNAGGFSSLTTVGSRFNYVGVVVTEGTDLKLAPGGTINIGAPAGGSSITDNGSLTVLGSISVPSGSIGFNGGGDIVVGPRGSISAAGQWVNNDPRTSPNSTFGGSQYIDGGSISLVTAGDNIDLQPGSLLDVSSGGEIQSDGSMLMHGGVPAGKGGDLSLISFYNLAGYSPPPKDYSVHMDGAIRGFGFEGGGTFSLQTTAIQFGGDPAQAAAGTLILPVDFFARQGFGNYSLNALYDITVPEDVTVRLTQQNLIPDIPALMQAASGADLWQGGLTAVGTVDPYYRQTTSLSMIGGYYLWGGPNFVQVSSGSSPGPIPVSLEDLGTVDINRGGAIVGDAGANIGIASGVQITVQGSIVAPGGAITLSTSTGPAALFTLPGQFTDASGFTGEGKSIWLGSGALLDTSGVALADPFPKFVKNGSQVFQPDTGKVLPGGSIVLADDTGYIVAQQGAVIDVSGASRTFDLQRADGSYAAQPVWSDAGSITLAASDGLYFDGTLRAQGGAPQAQGGTLNLIPLTYSGTRVPEILGATANLPGATALILQPAGAMVPEGLQPGQSITAVTGPQTGVLQFSTDRLAGSGIGMLVLGNGQPRSDADGSVPIAFRGAVDLNLARGVAMYTESLSAISDQQLADLLPSVDPADTTGATWLPAKSTLLALLTNEASHLDVSDLPEVATAVNIDAPYFALVGPPMSESTSSQLAPRAALADGTLTVNASFIDLVNQTQINNFGQATFNSTGDIRLTTTNPSWATGSPNALTPGEFYSPGNITFAAADLYPSTGSVFILNALGPKDASGKPLPTTIAFRNNGTSSTPLSAGGTLLVDATDIVQGGTVRAPSGSLIFGVGDATDPDTKALFNSMPLVNTESVTLASGSVTSVSNGGAIIPYGTTVDGVEWQFNPRVDRTPAPDVTAPPSKYIGVNGSSVALAPGASIDLSGGGDLQAMEWVAGTGGSRDVLSQYNVSYAASAGGAAVPWNVGAPNIYAIVPGAQTPVAAYDPVMAQTLQPIVNANGSTGSATLSMGVGQASMDGVVGQAVYLQGVAGLPNGVYTLLPAKYATLPGAYRVTVNTTGTAQPGEHFAAPDGTQIVAGYWSDALSGARAATPTLFDVQPGSTWQQYSQYTLTRGDDFFATQAASKGVVAPALARDAGQLVLAASQALSLGAKLNTAAADGGAPAQVDIASQDIQIVGQGQAALPGYLQISATDLDALGAGSLLIGGSRTRTNDGISIEAIANSVVVSNDAAHPLTGPEIILVTKTIAGVAASGSRTSGSGASGSAGGGAVSSATDPNAANGLRIDSGSVIAATGQYPASKDVSITIGGAPDNSGNGGVSGDGALLMVSNGAPVAVTRINTTAIADNNGLLTVAAGANLSGGLSLILDSSGDVRFDPAASLSGDTIAVDGSRITFTDKTGADAAAIPGFVVGASQIAQLANARTVILRSYGSMVFDGNIDARFGNDVDLSSGVFQSTGGVAVIEAPKVAFTNEAGALVPDSLPAGSGSLTVNANEIDLGAGNKAASGFAAVALNAGAGVVGQNTGTFDFGSAPVTVSAPVYLADTGSDATLKTSAALNLNAAAGTALNRAVVGGALTFLGGIVNDNGATILAPAGNVTLEASDGDLNIAAGSLVAASGVAKQFFDMAAYAPAGTISLTSDTGTVNVAAGATLDFSGAQGGGAAGSLKLSAPVQTVNLAGTIKGGAAPGFQGGSFSLDTGGAVDLDSLVTVLATSGVTNAIDIQTHTGNLTLSAGHTIAAHHVSLTADGGAGGQDTANGKVTIIGTIDATGLAGGEIDLYGKSGVELDGSLIARACANGVPCGDDLLNPSQRGGTVNIGTTAIGNPADINSTYGYENVTSAQSGWIVLGANSLIDVSGGTAGGLSGGTVNFRAPLVDTATGAGSVNVRADAGARVVGSRATTVEAYAVWSTDDHGTGNQHFDGIVDAAGWYDAQGHLLAGMFTSQDGNTTFTFTPDGTGGGTLTNTATGTPSTITADQLQKGDEAIGFGGLTSDTFAPGTANADHVEFYGYQSYVDAQNNAQGTLMKFVSTGVQGAAAALANTPFAGMANFAVVPGIELSNPDKAINNGDISILSTWNLGAGNSPTDLAFRFNGHAPVITFRAENNVDVKASLTDGFFQIANPINPGSSATVTVPGFASFDDTLDAYYNYATGPFVGQFSATLSNSGRTVDAGTLAYYGHYSTGFYPGIAYAPANLTGGTPVVAGETVQQEIDEYLALYSAYAHFLQGTLPLGVDFNLVSIGQRIHLDGPPVQGPTPPSAADQAKKPGLYLLYLTQYSDYLTANYQFFTPLQNVQPPQPVLTATIGQPVGSQLTVTTPALATNTAALLPTADNPLPLLSASLAGGSSTSFRVVAGADTASANPLAVQAASMFSLSRQDNGSVILDGHTAYVDPNDMTLVTPSMIRTGTGSISVAAGNGVALLDTTAPGVIYAGGAAADGTPQGTQATIVEGNHSLGVPDYLVTPAMNPDSAGDVSIVAQGDIVGVGNVTDPTGDITGWKGSNIGALWTPWLLTGNPTGAVGATKPQTQTIQTSINFGAFDQGVLSVGGNVSVVAGGDITNLGVSLPTTWYLTDTNTDAPVAHVVGGGNLMVNAAGNILGGSYFVAKGTGTLTAGGRVGPDSSIHTTYDPNNPQRGLDPIVSIGPVSTILATQDGTLNVSARQGVDIATVINPSYTSQTAVQAYSQTSSVSLASTTGDIEFGTLGQSAKTPLLLGGAFIVPDDIFVLPATVDMTAFTGGIDILSAGELAPSPIGNLSLLADQNVHFSSVNGSATPGPQFGMLDVDPSDMPSSVNPDAPLLFPDVAAQANHAETPLHAGDDALVRIYSLEGDIVDGTLQPPGTFGAGFYNNSMGIVVDKPALVQAGRDIVNLAFLGQNLREADITRIVAGRDIYDTPRAANLIGTNPQLALSGPGTFDVEAGRDIGPLTSERDVFLAGGGNSGLKLGIEAIGNNINSNLPHESADINVLFGVGPGVDLADFIARYIDPSSAGVGDVVPATAALVAFMQDYDAGKVISTGLAKDKKAAQVAVGTLTVDDAWAQFQALPAYVRQMFAEKTLFSILTRVGQDFNDPNSPDFQKYERGYAAINTLFPASWGYTPNNLEGGGNGANKLVDTGNLDIRSTTIQTQQGGNISILGPGGQALVGSTSAPPVITDTNGNVVAGPGTQGILTLEQGDINIFTDRSLLLAQSRIFTEQGGAMTIWSSNGDINAGKGAKSAADIPPPMYVCDINHYCTVDVRGEVTGAGIATLQTIPGAPASDANLIAPRGTVDAGDAGIRVSGNLNVAALHVANADNIQVQGKSTGIPIVAAVNVSALTSASAAANAAADAAENLGRQQQAAARQALPSIITVQVLGFGNEAPVSGDVSAPSRPKAPQVQSMRYDETSPLQFIGVNDDLEPSQLAQMSDAERRGMAASGR